MSEQLEYLNFSDLWNEELIKIRRGDDDLSDFDRAMASTCNKILEIAHRYDPAYKALSLLDNYLNGTSYFNRGKDRFFDLIFGVFLRYIKDEIKFTPERRRKFILFYLKFYDRCHKAVKELPALSEPVLIRNLARGDTSGKIYSDDDPGFIFNADTIEAFTSGELHVFLMWLARENYQSQKSSEQMPLLFFTDCFKYLADGKYYRRLLSKDRNLLKCFSRRSAVDDLYENMIIDYVNFLWKKNGPVKNLSIPFMEKLFFYYVFVYCCRTRQNNKTLRDKGVDVSVFGSGSSDFESVCTGFGVSLYDVFVFYREEKNRFNLKEINQIQSSWGKFVTSFLTLVSMLRNNLVDIPPMADLLYGIADYNGGKPSGQDLILYRNRIHYEIFRTLMPEKLAGITDDFLKENYILKNLTFIRLYVPEKCLGKIRTPENYVAVFSVGRSMDSSCYCVVRALDNVYIFMYSPEESEVSVYKLKNGNVSTGATHGEDSSADSDFNKLKRTYGGRDYDEIKNEEDKRIPWLSDESNIYFSIDEIAGNIELKLYECGAENG